MNKINRKMSLAESMISPRKYGPFSCCLKLETDSILLMKLRAIFKVNTDKEISNAIVKHLKEFAKQKEQKSLENRMNLLQTKE